MFYSSPVSSAHICPCTGRSIYTDSKLKMDDSVRNAVALLCSSIVQRLFAGGLSAVTFQVKCRNRPSQSGFPSVNTSTHVLYPQRFTLLIVELLVKSDSNADRCEQVSEQQGETGASGFTINVLDR